MQTTCLILLEGPMEGINERVGIIKRRNWEIVPVAFQMSESETRWFLLKPEGKKKSDSSHPMAALWFKKEVTGRACKES